MKTLRLLRQLQAGGHKAAPVARDAAPRSARAEEHQSRLTLRMHSLKIYAVPVSAFTHADNLG